VLVAHACNPSYSGGRDQEHLGSKSARANSSRDPILEKPITKKGWWSGSRCSPEFKPQYCQKKKKGVLRNQTLAKGEAETKVFNKR
jgi:hypothetical protein